MVLIKLQGYKPYSVLNLKLYLVIVVSLTGFLSYSQLRHIPNNDVINGLPKKLAQYIPPGYAAMDTLSGDLNRDSYNDFIMVLKKTDEDTIFSYYPARPLLLFTGQADGTLKFREKNDDAVMCIGCGGVMGDPYMGVVIKNGYFSVEHYGGSAWRWTKIYTFKYIREEDTWILHKIGGESFHATEPEKVESYLQTRKDFGKVYFKDFKKPYD